MFGKHSLIEFCGLISLILVLFCMVNVRSVQLVKLSDSLPKSWLKTSVSQKLRTIRGFRPETLSTARGFGKRAELNLDLNAQRLNGLNNYPKSLFDRLRSFENQYNKENDFVKEQQLVNLFNHLDNLYREDRTRYLNGLNHFNVGINDLSGNKKIIERDSDENLRKNINEDEISNNY